MNRQRTLDNRNHLKGLRLDRHEKVDNWPKKIFNKVISKVKIIFLAHIRFFKSV